MSLYLSGGIFFADLATHLVSTFSSLQSFSFTGFILFVALKNISSNSAFYKFGFENIPLSGNSFKSFY